MVEKASQIAQVLAPFTGILLFLGAVAALVVYLYKFGKKITASLTAAKSAEHAANSAAEDARGAADNSYASHEVTLSAANALEAAVAALNTMKDRHDDLLTAYINQETLEGRMRRLEQWAADHEDTRFAATRAISTTGAEHAEQ